MSGPEFATVAFAIFIMALVFSLGHSIGHGAGVEVGRAEQKVVEAQARAYQTAKPGDAIPCRDPQAVREAVWNGSAKLGTMFFDEKGHLYRLPPNPRDEIALRCLIAVLTDPSVKIYGEAAVNVVKNCFGLADEFIKQSDGPEEKG